MTTNGFFNLCYNFNHKINVSHKQFMKKLFLCQNTTGSLEIIFLSLKIMNILVLICILDVPTAHATSHSAISGQEDDLSNESDRLILSNH